MINIMWKFKINLIGKSNMKKRTFMFVLVPTAAYMQQYFGEEKEFSLNIVWLFFELQFRLLYNWEE